MSQLALPVTPTQGSASHFMHGNAIIQPVMGGLPPVGVPLRHSLLAVNLQDLHLPGGALLPPALRPGPTPGNFARKQPFQQVGDGQARTAVQTL
jgi:hypothetical protein